MRSLHKLPEVRALQRRHVFQLGLLEVAIWALFFFACLNNLDLDLAGGKGPSSPDTPRP
jgi:hypothetical protein